MTSFDVFDVKNRRNFVEYADMCIEHLHAIWPDCPSLEGAKQYMQNLSDENITELIQTWKDNIVLPLVDKKVKYAKAVQHILSSPPQIYHAIAYKDTQACGAHLSSKFVSLTKLNEKLLKDCSMTEDQKTYLFKIFDKMSRISLEYFEVDVPRVPTRDEIKDNIQKRKEFKLDEAPSMTKAFQTHMNALCSQVKAKKVFSEDAKENQIQAVMKRWNQFANNMTENVKNADMCNTRDIKVLESLRESFPELSVITSSVSEETWKTINQLNGFSAVNENIPSRMMGRIESMASKLADDIVSGKTDMASVNLSDIGQQVLSGCSEDDMSNFAGNIDALLPALQSFHQNTR